jgi:glutamate-1-semialdehyde 2,1-aminomutase
MFTFFFTEQPITDYDSARTSNTQRFAQFFHWMLTGGIYLAPSQFEAGFMSAAHSEEDVAKTVERAKAFPG